MLCWFLPNINIQPQVYNFSVAHKVKNLLAVQETWVWSLVRKILLRREWQPTPVFLPWESHGQRSLAGCSPWGHKELDMTEWLSTDFLLEPPSGPSPCPIPPGCHRSLECRSLSYIAYSLWLSILPIVMYISQCYSLNLSNPRLPLLFSQVCFLC